MAALSLARCCLGLLVLALAACASVQAPPARPLTVLVSIDGFRADYLQRGLTPAIAALAADGVRAERMRPSYPSLTYPNHYTLVTGLRPDRHGLVNNAMEDPARPGTPFKLSDRTQVEDRFWWDDAEPIWVTAERAGLRTGVLYWPGSEAPIHGRYPTYWRRFDQTVAAGARVDQALAWLDGPAASRPRFLALYFDEVDTTGHDEGPDSAALNAALARTDAAIARLVEGLRARGLNANIVVTADHGMAPISIDRITYLDDLLPAGSYRVVTFGSSSGIVPAPGLEAEVETILLGPHPHMQCWRKGEMPTRFHYGSHRRVPPIVCLAQTGWLIDTRARISAHPPGKGAHGFDPADPQMAALFVAQGPAFRRGVVLPTIDNVDAYPLLARLIGVQPQDNDGDLTDVARGLTR